MRLPAAMATAIKRAPGLISLDRVLDLDLKIARFVPDLDYLMASTPGF